MKPKIYKLLMVAIAISITIVAHAQTTKGLVNKAITLSSGETIPLFDKSYALIIANDQYQYDDWSDLSNPYSDGVRLKKVLKEIHGFDSVIILRNQTYEQMIKVIDNFIKKFAMNEDNRVVIFYSGHGDKMKVYDNSTENGFIVPVDCPEKSKDKSGFLVKSIGYSQWEAWARDMQCRHALFVFDCCYGGMVFKESNKASEISTPLPVNVEVAANNYVRFFMTAGHQDQQVPDRSLFLDYFLRAISGEDPAADEDYGNKGYLTGFELGSYVQTKVYRQSKHAYKPLFGIIEDPNLDKGNFIFVLPGNHAIEVVSPVKPITIEVTTLTTYGSIELTSELTGSLYLDGAFLKIVSANTLVTLRDIPSGSHTLEIRGTENWEQNLTVYKDQKNSLTATSTNKKTINDYGIEMAFVKGGTFTMGCTSEQSDCSDDEKPTHQVTVSDFYIGKYEVTQKQWKEIMGTNPSYFKNCDNCPVEMVSWNDVQEFITKLNQKTGKTYRLPTEAEWEYAARGGASTGSGSTKKYAGSNNIDEVAWCSATSGLTTHNVGQKKANELGLYDMSGNVWEWCSDWYGSDYYNSNMQYNPQGPASGSNRVFRGGGWFLTPEYCRVAIRSDFSPDHRFSILGFRLVLSL